LFWWSALAVFGCALTDCRKIAPRSLGLAGLLYLCGRGAFCLLFSFCLLVLTWAGG